MNTTILTFRLSLLLVAAALAPISAQGAPTDTPLMVSRDSGGSINKESVKVVKLLSKMAKRNGHVRLWVTLDMPFDPFLASKSEQAAAAQQARVDGVFDEVLNPLLDSGQIRYVNGRRVYSGPSVLLMATENGLSLLVRDQRVGQLVGVREQ